MAIYSKSSQPRISFFYLVQNTSLLEQAQADGIRLVSWPSAAPFAPQLPCHPIPARIKAAFTILKAVETIQEHWKPGVGAHGASLSA